MSASTEVVATMVMPIPMSSRSRNRGRWIRYAAARLSASTTCPGQPTMSAKSRNAEKETPTAGSRPSSGAGEVVGAGTATTVVPVRSARLATDLHGDVDLVALRVGDRGPERRVGVPDHPAAGPQGRRDPGLCPVVRDEPVHVDPVALGPACGVVGLHRLEEERYAEPARVHQVGDVRPG